MDITSQQVSQSTSTFTGECDKVATIEFICCLSLTYIVNLSCIIV